MSRDSSDSFRTAGASSVPEEGFRVTLGGFSGPLDLLCHLVESSAMDAVSLNLSDLLSQYVSFLLRSRRATLSELAEFFSFASRLLLHKVKSLLPWEETATGDDGTGDGEKLGPIEGGGLDEDVLRALVERFRPYRAAAALLSERKASRERSFVRISEEGGGPPWFDAGDLYGLAVLWWTLIEGHEKRRIARTEAGFIQDVPDALPDEIVVENRMEEIQFRLGESGRLSLRELLGFFEPGGLVVTLLALLELSRLGRLNLVQAEAWGDVEIAVA